MQGNSATQDCHGAENVFFAHTPPDDDAQRWQTMREHLSQVSSQAEEYGVAVHAAELARWCGLVHDIGKYSDAFQCYLQQCHDAALSGGRPPAPGSAEHKNIGAQVAHSRLSSAARLVAEFCILGHHGGLFDNGERQNALSQATGKTDSELLLRRATADFPELTAGPAPELHLPENLPTNADKARYLELLGRMVFSCLVDADSLDCERHFTHSLSELRQGQKVRLVHVLDEWQAKLRAHIQMLQARMPDGSLKDVRREVVQFCLSAGRELPGVFSLTVPTGGGKTLASLAFALEHAKRHHKNRVIYAIPYTSIGDQTASAFRKVLGDNALLEHHSAVEARIGNEGADSPERQSEYDRELKRRLAAQNWDAPLVVTTTVQLIESLFANRTTRCRKLHNVANSIVILDEVQTLPERLLSPILDKLKLLVDYYGVTVVLCTATQPAFRQDSPFLKGFETIAPIIPDPRPHFGALKRVTYAPELPTWTWQALKRSIQGARCSTLTVLNTKKDALAVLDALDDPGAFHLSTLLCGAHRKQVLSEIKHGLEREGKGEGGAVTLVSTQVVEAGVDLDFPRVYRAKGPLDRIIQAAGRCNREGTRPAAESIVTVFDPAEGKTPPGDYRTALTFSWNWLASQGAHLDLHSPEVAEEYFRKLYAVLQPEAMGKSINEEREKLNYRQVAARMRLIEKDTVAVLVPYHTGHCPNAALSAGDFDNLVREIQSAAKQKGGVGRVLWQEIQPLTVAVYAAEVPRLGLLPLIDEELYLWTRSYDPVRGIGGAVAADPADLIA